MASRSASPGGALLRASRIFAIPPPLPRPMGDLSAQAIFNSDTATLPHPTHLSITTTPSSRARGDWGFKRPLPLRATTKSSTPFIRIKAIDTFEHITEFGSSADHALSLQKWQEMGVPLTVPMKKNTGNFNSEERKSVFDDDIDSTVEMGAQSSSRKEDVRWSFKGPWLAGMTEGDFNTFVVKRVRDKKSEFRKYLRAACARSLTAKARRNAIGDEEPPAAIETEDVAEEQMTEYVKRLRYDRTELFKLIRAFLDLPPPPSLKASHIESMINSMFSDKPSTGTTQTFEMESFSPSASPYAENGPPKTHPSAGLAYSLTDAHVYNHPEFGPQKSKPPIQARVVLPKKAGVGNFAPKLGVGGFVTEVPAGSRTEFKTNLNRKGAQESVVTGLDHIDPGIKGGSKVYVEPLYARIDPSGKAVMEVAAADRDAIAIHEGTTDQIQKPTAAPTRPSWKGLAGLKDAALAGSAFAMDYGLSGKRDALTDYASPGGPEKTRKRDSYRQA